MLDWSQNKDGAWNGKIGDPTLFTVAYHKAEYSCDTGWQVHPKLPGLTSKLAHSEEEGKLMAEYMCRDWFSKIKAELGKDTLD